MSCSIEQTWVLPFWHYHIFYCQIIPGVSISFFFFIYTMFSYQRASSSLGIKWHSMQTNTIIFPAILYPLLKVISKSRLCPNNNSMQFWRFLQMALHRAKNCARNCAIYYGNFSCILNFCRQLIVKQNASKSKEELQITLYWHCTFSTIW